MPIITVIAVPYETPRHLLVLLRSNLKLTVLEIPELDLSDPGQVSVYFPRDLLEEETGAPEGIIVRVTELYQKPERTTAILNRLAHNLLTPCITAFPNSLLECFVYTFDPTVQAVFRYEPPPPR